jgi:hypothetical protein
VAENKLEYVLITGAGASCAFGAGGTRLPMMADWSNALVTKLLNADGYLAASGLFPDMEPMKFEQQLGRFLRQVTAFSQVRDLVAASKQFPPAAGMESLPTGTTNVLEMWHMNTRLHLEQINELIRESLYEQFAEQRPDAARAREAYRDLLTALQIGPSTPWVYVTTNYDTIGETALATLDLLPDWGEPPQVEGSLERPIRVDGLLDIIPRSVPVLHIHGRVGWYRRSGPDGSSDAYSLPAATRHQQGRGVPIVMLPDPDKAYDADPIINALWLQFIEVLRRARRVFILGHSLNDAQLVQAIKDHVQPTERIAVTVLSGRDNRDQIDPAMKPQEEQVLREFPTATIIPIRFGDMDVYVPRIQTWLQSTRNL